MLRRVLLLLLCCILPLQSVRADADVLAHVWQVDEAAVTAAVTAPVTAEMAHDGHGHHGLMLHHHHMEAASQLVHEDGSPASAEHMSDHCVCPLGCLLPVAPWVVHRVTVLQTLPEWTPRRLPEPVLPGLQRPPHPAG